MVPWQPGLTVADRFVLREQIGKGSIGAVWKAHDQLEDEVVAIKLVVFGEGRKRREQRFEREAHATMHLACPHVVRVIAFGTNNIAGSRVGYLAMEMLDGETLAAHLRRAGAMSPTHTLEMFEQVGRALSLAHHHGLVHRDVKPANIFLCRPDRQVKILDFGLAKSLGSPLVRGESALTRVGDMLGTPLYMSPEQSRGVASIDHRTDLWALGVIAFECLVGRRPFEADNLGDLLEQLEELPIVEPSTVASVPEGFDAWFARAVGRDVQLRFQTASALVAELSQVLAPERTRRVTRSVPLPVEEAPTAESARTARMLREPSAVLFGRASVLTKVEEALHGPTRVLSFIGSRGTGRSALARAYALAHRDVYTGGVCWVGCAGTSDEEAMWRRLAAETGAWLPDADAEHHLGRAVATMGRVLVVLERVERVRELIGPVVAALLRAAPLVTVVATCDQPLGVASERAIEVRGLAVPAVDADPLNAALSSSAMRLFAARVGLGCERLSPTLLDAATALVREVHGNPMAIELVAQPGVEVAVAAAAARSLPTDDSDAAVKAVALSALSDLDPVHRSALLQLSTFRGAFSLEAAEQVVDLSVAGAVSMAVATAMHGLIDRRWLRPHPAMEGFRYTIHPLVRKVCSRVLADVGLANDKRAVVALIDRHAKRFGMLGDPASIDALERRGGKGLWQRALDDAEDVAAAFERAQKRRQGPLAGRCALALATVELGMGRDTAAARSALTAMSALDGESALFARLGLVRVRALAAGGREEAAQQLARRVATHAASWHPSLTVDVQVAVATAERHVGDRDRAVQAAISARAAARSPDRVADADRALAAVHHGDPVMLLGGAVATHRALGESRCEAHALFELALAQGETGERAAAARSFDEAVAIQLRIGQKLAAAKALWAKGRLLDDAGAADRAQTLRREVGAEPL